MKNNESNIISAICAILMSLAIVTAATNYSVEVPEEKQAVPAMTEDSVTVTSGVASVIESMFTDTEDIIIEPADVADMVTSSYEDVPEDSYIEIEESESDLHAEVLVDHLDVPEDDPCGLYHLKQQLDRSNGKVYGPSGHETYYNLDMSGCIRRMRNLGYDYEYWVRDDGVKMFGEYAMVAADFNTRPLGTVVETTRGMGIVVDTGDFTNSYPDGIDIAVTWTN